MTAPYMEAPGPIAADQAQGQSESEHLHCAQTDAGRKPFATLAARAALAGCTLHSLSGGGFLLCRWGMAKELPDLRAVAALLSRMGVRV